MWKRTYISKEGKLALIKSTLLDMSFYAMSLFRNPKSMATRLEEIQRDFLFAEGATLQKKHLVAWDVFSVRVQRKGWLEISSYLYSTKHYWLNGAGN